jgi:hypothetical protein
MLPDCSLGESARTMLSCKYVQVRDLVDQIRRVRDNKINQGLELVTGPLTAKLNNLCCMELNTLRPFFLGSLDRFLRISRVRPAS